MKAPLAKTLAGLELDRNEARDAMDRLLGGDAAPAQAAAFLGALRVRGETSDELVGFAEALRARMHRVPAPIDAVDTCGTGGASSDAFNVSTAAAFVVAAAGATIAKHGNRAVSSRCGSADVLEALGVPIDLAPAAAARELRRTGFSFLLAPLYHPAFRALADLRRAIGQRTVLNLLGPLANPAGVRRQLVGVPESRLLLPFAEALRALGARHALVAHAEDGLDEISVCAPTRIAELDSRGRVREYRIRPEDFGLALAAPNALAGGDAAKNARILVEILAGRRRGPLREAVALNAGAALHVAGRAIGLADGFALASSLLDSSAALAALERARAGSPLRARPAPLEAP